MNPPRILIVDDDAELQGLIVRLLTQEGWAVESALTVKDGERLLAQHRPSVVLLDVMLADGNGLDVCRRWRAQQPDLGLALQSSDIIAALIYSSAASSRKLRLRNLLR